MKKTLLQQYYILLQRRSTESNPTSTTHVVEYHPPLLDRTLSATGCTFLNMPVRDLKIGHAVGQGSRGHQGSATSPSQDSEKSTLNADMPEPFPSAPPGPVATPPFPSPLLRPFIEYAPAPAPFPSPLREPSPNPNTQSLEGVSLPVIPPARYKNMPLNQGKVKCVLSGDTLVLSSVENPERERTLSLAYCTAPHLRKEGDEQWAFESRDALRKMVVGKHVQFQVLYTIPNTKREYGIVFLNDGQKLPEQMVQEGWLKLRDDAGRKEDTEEAIQQLSQLRVLEATARSEDKGIWAPNGARIDVQHDMGDPQAFMDNWKGKTIDGMVERVLSGDRMLIRLIINPTKHVQGEYQFLALAGSMWILKCDSLCSIHREYQLTSLSYDFGCWNPRTYHRTCQSLKSTSPTSGRIWKRGQIICRRKIITEKRKGRHPWS